MKRNPAMSEVRYLNTVLFLIFLTLKLCHVITWSWWWIFAPFWGPLALCAALLPFAAVFFAIRELGRR